MGILNYTTTIAADKTAAEIVLALAKHGASSVASTYENGQPTGIAFAINTQFGPREFRLPVNATGVFNALRADRTVPPRYQTKDQATRVAWRIIKDWIEAQIALIEAGQAKLDETMLPYMVQGGQTVVEVYRAQYGRLAIEAPSIVFRDEVVDAEVVG